LAKLKSVLKIQGMVRIKQARKSLEWRRHSLFKR
jgi:hypothetical protein